MTPSILDDIVDKYYRSILHYCRQKLHGDLSAAEDCTQEVFLILYQKINLLDMKKDIRPWLFRTADKVIKAYIRKNAKETPIEEIPILEEAPVFHDSILDILTDDERRLLELYYQGADKEQLDDQLGITLPSLYQKLARIRHKLLDELGKLHN